MIWAWCTFRQRVHLVEQRLSARQSWHPSRSILRLIFPPRPARHDSKCSGETPHALADPGLNVAINRAYRPLLFSQEHTVFVRITPFGTVRDRAIIRLLGCFFSAGPSGFRIATILREPRTAEQKVSLHSSLDSGKQGPYNTTKCSVRSTFYKAAALVEDTGLFRQGLLGMSPTCLISHLSPETSQSRSLSAILATFDSSTNSSAKFSRPLTS